FTFVGKGVKYFAAKKSCKAFGSELAVLKNNNVRQELFVSSSTSACNAPHYWVGLEGTNHGPVWLDGDAALIQSFDPSKGCQAGAVHVNSRGHTTFGSYPCSFELPYLCFSANVNITSGESLEPNKSSDHAKSMGIAIFSTFFLTLALAALFWFVVRRLKRSRSSNNVPRVTSQPAVQPVDDRGYIDLCDVTYYAGERGGTWQLPNMNNTGPEYCTIDPPRRADANNPYLVPLPTPR
uniref:Uncharacterized LOC100180029 n=1 Tax=Ciona intestinalis TaxID=7719 RepID=F7B0M6_CIOIN